jgi:primosomal protein N' (replication factor Y)
MEPRLFAEVVVFSPAEASVSGTVRPAFTYHLPDELRDQVTVGSLVVVPFGPRRLYGTVVGLSAQSPVPETRPVESLVDPEPVLTPAQIALARWLSHKYLAPLRRCLTLMLPPGVVGHADVQVELTGEIESRDVRTEAQEHLITVLDSRGPLRGRQLDRVLPRQQWRTAASQLARRGLVVTSPLLAPPPARPKQVHTAEWIARDVDADTALAGLRSECYPAIVRFLRAEGGPVDVSWVYAETGCTRYHLNKLAERDLIAFDTEEVWRDPLADETFVPDTPPPLTSDQEAVWDAVQSAIVRLSASRLGSTKHHDEARDPRPATFLLHGVTGSGKTEIYLRSVAEMLARGQQAIVLVPEISLTPQTAHRFGARFGQRIAILHSALTAGERYDTWRRARAGLVDVVVGPRSALFVPFPNLGLIVLDEEHDASYKQEEIGFETGDRRRNRIPSGPLAPFYHTRDTALELARLTGATVILGSATPSLESYHRAQRGEFSLLEMPRRIMGHTRRLHDLQTRYRVPQIRYHALHDGPAEARYIPLPPVQIVDLRAELRAGNRSIFSRALQRVMDEALGRGEQVILFLNRRGTATFVLCRDCGTVLRCPRCDTPLTYHSPRARLICHHCNHREPQPERCPQCGGQRIRYFGLGTERVEQAIHQRWPDVRTLRWDRDTARNHAAHATILHLFSSGLAHVLIGTQMIAKGLDLPLVTVVGIISADTALNLPDFRSGERTFQLLTQVAGRAGRGLLGGRVILQTYHPDHYAVVAAAAHDYAGFTAQELAFRREQGYPPYRRLAKLAYEDASPSRARAEAEALADILRDTLARWGLPATDLIGPSPPFFARLRGRYRWQMLLRHPNPAELLRAVQIPPGWRVDVDPVSVL